MTRTGAALVRTNTSMSIKKCISQLPSDKIGMWENEGCSLLNSLQWLHRSLVRFQDYTSNAIIYKKI